MVQPSWLHTSADEMGWREARTAMATSARGIGDREPAHSVLGFFIFHIQLREREGNPSNLTSSPRVILAPWETPRMALR